MRVFFVGSNLPTPGHTVRAATVLVRNSLLTLRELGLDVTFQPLLLEAPEPQEASDLVTSREWAVAAGVEVLEPLRVVEEGRARRFGYLRDAVSRDPGLFYAGWRLRDETAQRIGGARADFVFHLWSPAALGACATSPAPVFAYYGNPDHKPIEARLRHPDLFGVPYGRLQLAAARLANARRKRVNVALMRTARWAANVCAVDAEFFAHEGHPDAFYIQNMWPSEPVSALRDVPQERNKIVGNLGGLYATGNTFGLWFLAREIVPALERRLGEDFSVHVFGAGQPHEPVARVLAHPRIAVRGFVDDIDSELLSSQVFVLANNNDPDFVVGHTRILHAWSLGVCLIAHRNTALAMPEVEHDVNALLGETGDEIADLVVRALEDDALRRRIGEGGRQTLTREFLPQVVLGRVLDRVRAG